MSAVLVLGAGLVSGPLVRYLLGPAGCSVTVADRDGARAEEIVGGHPKGEAREMDVGDRAALVAAIRGSDLVVSLLPQMLHPPIAAIALDARKPFVTTSYVSPSMAALNARARRAGVLLLNEIGLDPGLDHMSAMRAIARIRSAGMTVVGFESCCGGLPAPEANTNPWGYKFSWSPRGALLACRNDARFLRDGSEVAVDGRHLFSHRAPYPVDGLGSFEVYPNRDSLAYLDTYGLSGVASMFRGTIRYPGWCETLGAVAALGLLDTVERDWTDGTTSASVAESFLPPGGGTVRDRVARRVGFPPDHPVLDRMEWAGLFVPRTLGIRRGAPVDVLCELLEPRMRYGPGERDMVLLRHLLVARRKDGTEERTVSTLLAFGVTDGDSAMSRTVSLPAAVAVRAVLEGRVRSVGVQIPTAPEVYEPILRELEAHGIRIDERVST